MDRQPCEVLPICQGCLDEIEDAQLVASVQFADSAGLATPRASAPSSHGELRFRYHWTCLCEEYAGGLEQLRGGTPRLLPSHVKSSTRFDREAAMQTYRQVVRSAGGDIPDASSAQTPRGRTTQTPARVTWAVDDGAEPNQQWLGGGFAAPPRSPGRSARGRSQLIVDANVASTPSSKPLRQGSPLKRRLNSPRSSAAPSAAAMKPMFGMMPTPPAASPSTARASTARMMMEPERLGGANQAVSRDVRQEMASLGARSSTTPRRLTAEDSA